MTRLLAPSARPDGLGQSALYRPVVMRQPQVKHVHLYAKFSRPLGYGQRLAVECQITVIALIARLFRNRCPAAIARLIVTVIVDTVNRMLRARARPHVGKEGLVGISPPLADGNAAAAVPMPVMAFGVGATVDHVAPSLILWHFVVAVNRKAGTLAATTERGSVSQMRTNDRPFFAARAAAKPFRLSGSVIADISNNRPMPTALAGHVVFHVLGNGYNLVSHVRTSFTNVMRGLQGVRSALQSPLFYHNGAYGQVGQGPRIQP